MITIYVRDGQVVLVEAIHNHNQRELVDGTDYTVVDISDNNVTDMPNPNK